VTVGGNWIASNLVAGAENILSETNFGDAGDQPISNFGNDVISSSITSIVIGGLVQGTPAQVNADDHFGFVAEQIGSLTVNGQKYVLNPLAIDNISLGTTSDVNLKELST
jgi:hypothetical protein